MDWFLGRIEALQRINLAIMAPKGSFDALGNPCKALTGTNLINYSLKLFSNHKLMSN